jgi:tripartite-type tricarboxylate transporter receptor subunit TctC
MKKIISTLILSLSFTANAFDIKSKPAVNVIIPFAPGGAVDQSFRHLQKYALDRGIVFTNTFKPGADGLIAMSELSKMPRDGFHMSVATVGVFSIHSLKKPEEENMIITELRSNIFAFVAHPASTVKTLTDLEQSLKNGNNVRIGYGSPGQLLEWEQYFELITPSVDPLIVPYKGTGPVINDLLGGHIDVAMVPIGVVKQHVSSGKLKLLAVTEIQPPEFLDTPLVNQKFPSWKDYNAIIITMPKGVDVDAVKFWNSFFQEYLKNKQVRTDMIEDGGIPSIFGAKNAGVSVQDFKTRYLKKLN